MSIVYTNPTSATLTGAVDWMHNPMREGVQQDVGAKLEQAFSAINTLNSAVSALLAAAVSAAGSGITWSAFSGSVLSTAIDINNFRS